MGWIARAQLASAVSNAGGLGIIETSSGELDAVRDEIRKMRDLTDKPFGVNIAQLFVRDPAIVDFVVEQGVRFVTTSAGDPTKYTAQLKAAGPHRLPRRADAARGAEGGRGRRRRPGGRGRRGRRLQEPARRRDHGAAAAGLLAGRRAGDRRRRHLRRPLDGGGVRARRRGRADGHAHGVGGRVAGARELEAGDRRRRRDRHRLPEPPPRGPACARCAPSARRARARRRNVDVGARPRARALLRRRHGGVDRALGPGRRPDRGGRAGRGDPRAHRARVRATVARLAESIRP